MEQSLLGITDEPSPLIGGGLIMWCLYLPSIGQIIFRQRFLWTWPWLISSKWKLENKENYKTGEKENYFLSHGQISYLCSLNWLFNMIKQLFNTSRFSLKEKEQCLKKICFVAISLLISLFVFEPPLKSKYNELN